MALFGPIFEALNRSGVRYVVVGGVATVLQGFPRLTADIDLVVDLEPAQARRAIDALVSLGLRPYAPVDPTQFADPAQRRRWIDEKNMRVFTLSDPQNPLRQVDLFVEHPVDFETLWRRADRVQLETTEVRVASTLRSSDRLDGLKTWPMSTRLPPFSKRGDARVGDDREEERDWAADWESHARWQLTAALESTPAQRLEWLEEAIELAYRAGALSKQKRFPD